MTGDEDPQQQQFQQRGGGFPGGGFGFPGGGINIEDLMRGFGGFQGGHQQQRHPGGRQQHQQRQPGGARYTFSFGGGEGVRY